MVKKAQEIPELHQLWISWLQEWRAEKAEAGSKAEGSYKKAAFSLSQCPIAFTHPSQLIQINGIGPKMVEMISARYKLHCEDLGIDMPTIEAPANKRGKKRAASAEDEDENARLEAEVDGGAEASTSKIKPRKPYVPKKSSGAYSIMVAMYQYYISVKPSPVTSAIMTKDAIIDAAQQYSTTSFAVPKQSSAVMGRTNYTAWSGMSKLKQEGLVHGTGRPEKFTLTHAGAHLAAKIVAVEGFATLDGGDIGDHEETYGDYEGDEFGGDFLSVADGKKKKKPRAYQPKMTDSEEEAMLDRFLASTADPSLGHLAPTPVAPSTKIITHVPAAYVRAEFGSFPVVKPRPPEGSQVEHRKPPDLDPLQRLVMGLDYVQKPRAAQSLNALTGGSTSSNMNRSASQFSAGTSSGPVSFWYLADDGCRVKKRPIVGTLNDVTFVMEFKIEFPCSQVSHPFIKTLVVRQVASERNSIYGYLSEEKAPTMCNGFVDEMPASKKSKALSSELLIRTESTIQNKTLPVSSQAQDPRRAIQRNHTAPRLSLPVPTPIARLSALPQVVKQHNFQLFDPIVMSPDDYDIVVYLDNREHAGRAIDPNRDRIRRTLEEQGIQVRSESLSIGDVLWVAHSNSPDGPRRIALDYVVERKRLDDLVTSIHDGRYEEQKFRLRQSCIRNIGYIVEDWKHDLTVANYGEAIQTCMSQIQVREGFNLTETRDVSETTQQLVHMTEIIKELYSGMCLFVIPPNLINRTNYCDFQKFLREQQPDIPYLTTYECHANLNEKDGALTIRDVFARQLMKIRGISAEKVSSVLGQWQTPHSIYNSLLQAQECDERHRLAGERLKPTLPCLIDDACGGSYRKRVGVANSTKIADMFTQLKYK